MERIPKSGELYRHFKGNLYQIIAIATHTETNEALVIYQALYGEFKVYARPITMFLSLVDKEKYKEAKQTYRFELVEREEIKFHQVSIEQEEKKKENNNYEIPQETSSINAGLFLFLDANTSKERIEILQELKKDMNEKLLDDIAVSLDLILEEESLEDKFDRIINYLRTRAKFERR